MTRIVTSLFWLSTILLGAALFLGFAVGDLYSEPTPEILRTATVHLLTGLAASLAVVLVNSIVMTYFIGTSRWVKEVCETYRLDAEYIRRSNALKRRTFPWAFIGMMTVVGICATGAAADPATGRQGTADWATPHMLASIAGIGLVLWTFYVELQSIAANHAIISEVLAEVRRIRTARGLEV